MTPTYQIALTRRATRDLNALHGQSSGTLSTSVSGMVRKIFAAFDSLGQVPHRTVVDPQPALRRPAVRSLPVPPYMVCFRVFDDRKLVLVTRVRHGSRRPLKRFY